MQNSNKILYILDGYSILFRAFYAVKELKINHIHLNAIFGSIKILQSIINKFQPEYMIVALDSGGKTFRDDLYLNFTEKQNIKMILSYISNDFIDINIKNQIINSEISLSNLQIILNINNDFLELFLKKNNLSNSYFVLLFLYLQSVAKIENQIELEFIENQTKSLYKANRKSVPLEMKNQFEIFLELLNAMNVKFLKYDNYEADDIIATYSNKFYNSFDEIIIISTDKDLKQLINNKVKIFDPVKKILIDESKCEQILQIKPSQVVDYLSIIGDTSDNIPGIYGIGPKNAINLLNKYNNIENIIINIDKIENDKIKDKIKKNIDILKLSYSLVQLEKNLNIEDDFNQLKFKFNSKTFYDFNKKYNFFKSNSSTKDESSGLF